ARLARGPVAPRRAPAGGDVGGVERLDPEREGAMDEGPRLDVVDRAAVRGPGAERDLGDLEAGVAERAVVHRPSSDREKTAASIVPAPALHGQALLDAGSDVLEVSAQQGSRASRHAEVPPVALG